MITEFGVLLTIPNNSIVRTLLSPGVRFVLNAVC